MMDYEKLGLLFLGLLNLGWLIYSNTIKSKTETSVVHVTDRAKLTDDLANLLEKTTVAREKLELENREAQKLLNALELENGKLKHLAELNDTKLNLQKIALDGFRADVEKLAIKNEKLTDGIDIIRETQIQHTENERLLKIENDELKIKVRDLQQGARETVTFYEKQMGEKETQMRKMRADIEKLKQILEENGIEGNI